jgi:hypothetical protein
MANELPTAPTVDQAAADLVGTRTGSESNLSTWAGPYVTEMLGRGQAIASTPYEAYMGPLAAGPSQLQQQAFQGLAGLTIPTEQMGAFTPTSFTQEGTAQRYMNPYLQQVLNPQLAELRRQADISRVEQAGRLAKAGAYGGGRQAVMESELQRALLDKTGALTGQAYSDAYNRAMQQFNVEEDRRRQAQDFANTYGMTTLQRMADLGATQRAIEAEGIAADRAQFEQEQAFPYKQTQYMQSLLQGLPLAAQQYTYTQPSQLENMLGGVGGVSSLYQKLFGGGTGTGGGGTNVNIGGGLLSGIGSLLGSGYDWLTGLFGRS